VPYGVSFIIAVTASSPTEFLGVMRGWLVEAPCVSGFVVGSDGCPGTGLRRRDIVGTGEGIIVFRDM
jgi:hypothetical protein